MELITPPFPWSANVTPSCWHMPATVGIQGHLFHILGILFCTVYLPDFPLVKIFTFLPFLILSLSIIPDNGHINLMWDISVLNPVFTEFVLWIILVNEMTGLMIFWNYFFFVCWIIVFSFTVFEACFEFTKGNIKFWNFFFEFLACW